VQPYRCHTLLVKFSFLFLPTIFTHFRIGSFVRIICLIRLFFLLFFLFFPNRLGWFDSPFFPHKFCRVWNFTIFRLSDSFPFSLVILSLPIPPLTAYFTVFVSQINLPFCFSCCQRYYIVLSLAPIGLLPVRLSSWLACVWGCRIVKGLCQYTSLVFRSLILACISISILRELRPGAHCSPARDPSFRLTDFLGVGYSTKGVALAPLNSLSPIYPSRTIL
jgi:hypothetical protein